LKRKFEKEVLKHEAYSTYCKVPNEGKNPLEIKATQGNIEHTPKPRIISTKST